MMRYNYYDIHKSHLLSKDIKFAWKQMECQNDVTPFLYYDYMKYVYWQTLFFSLWKPCIYYITDANKRVVFIAPMKYHIITGKIGTLGNIGFCDITDFLYHYDLGSEERKGCVSLLRKTIGRPFKLSRIIENSSTISYLENNYRINDVANCVNIPNTSDYESHINVLSKSIRQNIRTAYNRLCKNSCCYEFKFYIGASTFPKQIIKNTKQVYFDRQRKVYSSELNTLKRIKHLLSVKFLRHDNFSLYKNHNSVNASLYINGEIAAFFGGVMSRNNDRIVIPRLAIDDKFKFYSPGYLLLCETMKYLLSHTDIRNIDLCRGTERYKTDMGGVLYKTLFLEIF